MGPILAFGCHPDDVEFMVAGTLALLADRGCEIHIATMTGGEVGSADQRQQDIRATRLQEAADAAAVIGAHYHYAGGYDLEVQYDRVHRQRVVKVIRDVDPQVVITQPPSDYLIDHEETSRLVRNAAFIASVPLYDCGRPSRPTQRIPHLYYCNATGLRDPFGRPLPLHMAVDITDKLATKRQMLACHRSQQQWLEYVNGVSDYLVNMEAWSQQQGELIDRPYAEGFIQHLGFGHPSDNILKTLLGDLCVEFESFSQAVAECGA